MGLGDGTKRNGLSSLNEPVGVQRQRPKEEMAVEKLSRDQQGAYRRAVRSGDYAEAARISAIPGFRPHVGGSSAEGNKEVYRQQTENRNNAGKMLYNQGPGDNGADAIEASVTKTGATGKSAPSERFAVGGDSSSGPPPVGSSATGGAATPPSGSTSAGNGIPERRPGESDFNYEERVKQARGQSEGAYGGDSKAAVDGLRDKFAKQDEARAKADPFKEGQENDWANGPYATADDIQERRNASQAQKYGDYLNSEEYKKHTPKQRKAKFDQLKEANPGFKVSDEISGSAARAEMSNRAAAGLDPFGSTAQDILALIPGAKKELADLNALGSDMDEGLDGYQRRKETRESGRILSPREESDAKAVLNNLPTGEYVFDDDGPNPFGQSNPKPSDEPSQPVTSAPIKEQEEASNSITGLGMDILAAGKGAFNYGKDLVKSFFEVPDRESIALNYSASADRFEAEAKEIREEMNQVKGDSNYAKGKRRELQTKANIIDGRAEHYRSYSEKIRTNNFDKNKDKAVNELIQNNPLQLSYGWGWDAARATNQENAAIQRAEEETRKTVRGYENKSKPDPITKLR
jgi:hypothetical protein